MENKNIFYLYKLNNKYKYFIKIILYKTERNA